MKHSSSSSQGSAWLREALRLPRNAGLCSQKRIAGRRVLAVNIGPQRCIVCVLRWEETTMRWKISRHGHDSRQVDLLAVIALVIIIVAAWLYFGESPEPPSSTAFIV